MNRSTPILRKARINDKSSIRFNNNNKSNIINHHGSGDQKTIMVTNNNNRNSATFLTSTKLIRWVLLAICINLLLIQLLTRYDVVDGSVLMKVCDPREIKTVTNRVCMLYKRTKNSDIKLDRQGNIRVTRNSEEEMSADKLATECCKKGCPPHIFAVNC